MGRRRWRRDSEDAEKRRWPGRRGGSARIADMGEATARARRRGGVADSQLGDLAEGCGRIILQKNLLKDFEVISLIKGSDGY
uniref:Uncharacterized protein n=1 Tax=Oryza rufipogon TaxID=4529 RepID=A0A0E0QE99_ORYRU